MADKPKNQAASSPTPAAPPKATAPVAPAKPAVIAKATPPASPAVPAKPLAAPAKTITPAERYKLIAEAAYYLAEKRGFASGHEAQDWLAAEKTVEAMLRTRR